MLQTGRRLASGRDLLQPPEELVKQQRRVDSARVLGLFVFGAVCLSPGACTNPTEKEPEAENEGQEQGGNGGAVGGAGGRDEPPGAEGGSGGETPLPEGADAAVDPTTSDSDAAAGGGRGGADAGTGGSGGNMGGTGGTGGRDLSANRETFFGASRCEGSGLRLCDGFEGPNIDTALWQVQKQGGNVVALTKAEHARGSQSLHVRAQNGFGFVKTNRPFPAPVNTYWARMFIKVKRFSTVDWAHWTVAEAAGKGDGSLIRVGGQYNSAIRKNRWGVGSDGGPTGDWTRHDADPNGQPQEPATNEWVCLEWLHDGQNDVTRFFVDAQEHPSLATTAGHGNTARKNVPYVMPDFQTLWFGWWQYQPDASAFDVWIDEVAVDAERIGCAM